MKRRKEERFVNRGERERRKKQREGGRKEEKS